MTEDNSAIVMGNEVGNVVWFDQKKGFGFIKVITPGSEYLNKEVFVHFSAIQSKNRFKKLYPGENVSLNIIKNTNQSAITKAWGVTRNIFPELLEKIQKIPCFLNLHEFGHSSILHLTSSIYGCLE